MKKYIFIAFLSFITLLGVSQTKTDTVISNIKQTALESLPDSSALTFTKVYSDIKSGITALSSSLKVGSEHVYEILVKQQLVLAFIWLTVLIIAVIMLIISVKIYNKLNQSKEDEWENPTILNVLCFIFLIFGCIGLISSLVNIDTIITGFINPEYGAIKEILKVIK